MASLVLQPALRVTQFVSQGGDLGSVTDAHMPRLYLLQWLKSDRALMMLFNDGTFQVKRRTELLLLLGIFREA